MNYSKLKDICITTQGIQISKDKQINKFKEGYIKYLYIADFKGENEEKFVENVYPEKIVTENDLVMANTGSPGAVFKGINGVLSNNLFKISFDRNILDRDFLYYYLASDKFQSNLQQRMKGGVQKHLGHKTIGEQDIPIIDINTQKRIVTVLNKSQKLIDKRKEQIEALDELVKSKFIEMFGDKDKYTYIKIEQLVSNKSDIVDGPFGSNLKTVDYVDDGVRVIQINNIGESNFRDKNKKYITEEKYKSLLKHSVVPGDIVVAKMGEPIGRACILPDYISKAVIVADCMKIRPNLAIINRKYLEFLLNTEEVKTQFRKYSQGSTRVRLNLTMLRQIKVLYPPIELQNQFADFLKQVDKLKFEMEKSLKELEDNFNSLMQKAFKGELFN